MKIDFSNIKMQYGNKVVLENFNLVIEDNQLVSLIGTSGSGKTSVLKMVNGLNVATVGSLKLDDKNIEDYNIKLLRRNIGYVIQDNSLFPHLSIYDNIAYVLKLNNESKEYIDNRVNELMELFSLDNSLLPLKPEQLSGGQQQRVGIARALANKPKILLMDEPFGAVDAITRKKLQKELLIIHNKLKMSILLVTHDVNEAILLSDKIVVMDDGKIIQEGSKEQLLNNPVNDFVKELFS